MPIRPPHSSSPFVLLSLCKGSAALHVLVCIPLILSHERSCDYLLPRCHHQQVMLISGFGEEARSPRRESLAHKGPLSLLLCVFQDRVTVCPTERHIKKVYNFESDPTTRARMFNGRNSGQDRAGGC